MMNMRDEYLIHKTHRTFRAWLLPFALLADNLNAISCNKKKTPKLNRQIAYFLSTQTFGNLKKSKFYKYQMHVHDLYK
jgi:hypothetical protein